VSTKPAAGQVFDLGGVMAPVQTLLNSIMAFIPKPIGSRFWRG